MPIDYAEWLTYNPKNRRALAERLRELTKSNRGIQRDILRSLEKEKNWSFTPSSLSRWIEECATTGRSSKFMTPVLYEAIVEVMHKDYGILIEGDDLRIIDTNFLGLRVLTDQSDKEFSTQKNNLMSVYAVYRYSHFLQGRYILRGRLEFVVESDFIRTKEFYRIKNVEDIEEISFNRNGWMLYRDNIPMIFSRKTNSRDVQVIYIHEKQRRNAGTNAEQIIVMKGTVVDCQDTVLYATPILIKHEGENPCKEDFLNAVRPSESQMKLIAGDLKEKFDLNYPHIIRLKG